jgi:hypothetical protein
MEAAVGTEATCTNFGAGTVKLCVAQHPPGQATGCGGGRWLARHGATRQTRLPILYEVMTNVCTRAQLSTDYTHLITSTSCWSRWRGSYRRFIRRRASTDCSMIMLQSLALGAFGALGEARAT